MSELASADQLSSLTIKPLKALCAAHGIDHGLSGKKKSEHVQRLLTIKKVTAAECQRHHAAAAAAPAAAGGAAAGATGKVM